LLQRIKRELLVLIAADGFSNVQDAIGVDATKPASSGQISDAAHPGNPS
jgi:hypothetical protein